VTKISLNLITGRTIQQGVSMEGGKEKKAYTKACGIIEMNPSDMKKLNVWKNTNVRVTSKFGSVIVKAVEATEGLTPGDAYIPMGPWANSVVDPTTDGTGMPSFKGVPIDVEVAINETILDSQELVRKACGLP